MTTQYHNIKNMKFYKYLSYILSVSNREKKGRNLANFKKYINDQECIEDMIPLIISLETPDPGDKFWADSPQELLKIYKKRTEKTKGSSVKLFLLQLTDLFIQHAFLKPTLALAFLVTITAIISTSYSGRHQLDSMSYLAQLKQTETIIAYLDSHPILDRSNRSFAFSSYYNANYFLIGTLYSNTCAYLISGDREKSISSLNQLKSKLPSIPVITEKITELDKLLNYHGSLYRDIIGVSSDLYPLLYEHSASSDDVYSKEMFSLGIWLNNLTLAAISKNNNKIQLPELIIYIKTLLNKDILAPGVQAKIENIVTLLNNEHINDDDSQQIIQLALEIQNVLL